MQLRLHTNEGRVRTNIGMLNKHAMKLYHIMDNVYIIYFTSSPQEK